MQVRNISLSYSYEIFMANYTLSFFNKQGSVAGCIITTLSFPTSSRRLLFVFFLRAGLNNTYIFSTFLVHLTICIHKTSKNEDFLSAQWPLWKEELLIAIISLVLCKLYCRVLIITVVT